MTTTNKTIEDMSASMSFDIDSLISKLKASEVSTHFWHLQTKNYAQHIALGGYYEALRSLIDTLAEVYMGCHNKRISMPLSLTLNSFSQMDTHFSDVSTLLDNAMKATSGMPDIQDTIIDIKNLVNKTRYLLTLK